MRNNLNDDIIVVKFGGSVLESEASIDRVAQLLSRTLSRGTSVVAVVSAMKGVTDSLLSLSRKVSSRIDPALLDELLSTGEKTSARLLAAALANRGLSPAVVDPDSPEWPIITDERHQDANPLLEETRRRVRKTILPLISEGKVPVVCGFLGRTREGKVTTLGRGGSDTTAVLLGSCLGAREVVLVKDVSGVYSTDPDSVSNPALIQKLDGAEAGMLAAGGAKFLHAKALRYQQNGLRIRVTSLDRLESGTVIEGVPPDLRAELSGSSVSMLTVVGMNWERFDAVAEAVRAVGSAGGTVTAISAASTAAILYIEGGKGFLEEVHRRLVESGAVKAVSLFEGLSMITITGSTLETQPGIIQRATQPLAREGINLFGVVTIHSSIRIFVSSERAGEALRLVKEATLVTER